MSESELQSQLDELQQKYASLNHEHEKLKHLLSAPHAELKLAIFEHLPNPIWACDRHCRIVFWNEGAARLYGYSADEAIGRDFVDLFVNEPEQEKARLDCVDIIDNNRPIKNMADDIDKHGNTRKLVTQCFALYDVEGHSGLQVEMSYEVQDIERLQAELLKIQQAFRQAEQEREELRRKLLDVTRDRGVKALDAAFASVRDSLRGRAKSTDEIALSKDCDKQMVAKARAEIKSARERWLKWEREMRAQLMSEQSVEGLESLIECIERTDFDDV